MNPAVTVVPVPDRLKARPLYRGLVLPYSAVVDDKGNADFRITDMGRWYECVQRKLCTLCGTELEYWVWYIGGGRCADQGIYFDLAMHEECCFYAAEVCPFLANGREYSNQKAKVEGYVSEARHDVVKSSILFASKRRRDQVAVAMNGGSPVVQTGPEVKRVQIYPKVI